MEIHPDMDVLWKRLCPPDIPQRFSEDGRRAKKKLESAWALLSPEGRADLARTLRSCPGGAPETLRQIARDHNSIYAAALGVRAVAILAAVLVSGRPSLPKSTRGSALIYYPLAMLTHEESGGQHFQAG